MPFTLPDFNLLCDIYTVNSSAPPGTHTLRLHNVPCNLATGRRVTFDHEGAQFVVGQVSTIGSTLLLPAGTDIRDGACGGDCDLVEVPAGSGRFYHVNGVDDSGKGFSNEHRVANLAKTWGFPGNGAGLTAPWPTPIP